MSLTRQRRKELDKLRRNAQDLWKNQRTVLDRANDVGREATRQLNNYSREEIAPLVRENYETYVRPGYERALNAARAGRASAEKTLGGLFGSALSVTDIAHDTRVRRALERTGAAVSSSALLGSVGSALTKRGTTITATKGAPIKATASKKSGGIGRLFAIGIGVTLIAGIAYAVWETFRADDELWVAEKDS